MIPYRKFAPTGFDTPGAFLRDQQEWLVLGVNQTRDSGPLARSNFEEAISRLQETGDEGEDWQLHRFGHWGPGWFEILIVRPGSQCETVAEAIEDALAGYPVLNEEHYSRLEWDESCEYWERMSLSERVEMCRRNGASIFAARRDEIPEECWEDCRPEE